MSLPVGQMLPDLTQSFAKARYRAMVATCQLSWSYIQGNPFHLEGKYWFGHSKLLYPLLWDTLFIAEAEWIMWSIWTLPFTWKRNLHMNEIVQIPNK